MSIYLNLHSLSHPIDNHVLICRIPHLENFSGNDKNVLLAQINKCKQIFVLYVHKNAWVIIIKAKKIIWINFMIFMWVTQEEKMKMYFRKEIDLIVL